MRLRMRRPDPAARWRGASAALLTVALSVGAHALADGPPSGAGVALAALLAVTLGAFSASTQRARGATGLIALLAFGQLLGHLVLAAAGHSHGAAEGEPTPLMIGAHAAAVAAGAVLIAAGDRLCRALSSAVRALTAPSSWPPEDVVVETTTSDQPLQSMLLLAASVSHRGPPVGALS
jgi:hypothetical protein